MISAVIVYKLFFCKNGKLTFIYDSEKECFFPTNERNVGYNKYNIIKIVY